MKQGGYTLLEAIVAIGIFSIVSLMAVGATITMLGAYNRTQATQVVVDTLNFSVEAMTRDVRFGKEYQSRTGGGIDVTFVEPDGTQQIISYYLQSGRLQREAGGTRVPVTPESVTISDFDVYVTGESTTDTIHPKATFVISGEFNLGSAVTEFSLQSTVSQRDPE